MKKAIQILVIILYFHTSCCVIGTNKWDKKINSQEKSFTEIILSLLTVSVSDYVEDCDSLVLFKDPKDENSVVTDYYPFFMTFNFTTKQNYFHSEEKIKDPYLIIFSPPPLLS